MTPRIRLTNGIELTLSSGERVVFDGGAPGDHRVLSHAHADHLFATTNPVVCSRLTAALASERRRSVEPATPPSWLELLPAGHIAGSRAALVTDPDTGTRTLYTGDINTRDRFFLDGFDPPAADVLVIEATYGRPAYRFPPTDRVVQTLQSWIAAGADAVTVLFGYPLGRAQKLQLIAEPAAPGRVLVSDAIATMNLVIERHRPITFPGILSDADTTVLPGDVLVLPTQLNRPRILDRLGETAPVRTAGVSGWAVDDAYQYRGGFDQAFPLSDHCDFDDLLGVVTAVDPDRVYTHHGFAADLATHLTQHGYAAQALRKNQSTLAEY